MSFSTFEGDEDATATNPVSSSSDSADSQEQNATQESQQPEKEKLVVLVDSHSLIYQVFHAMQTMTAPDGTEVGAVYGFFRDLADLRDRYEPEYLLCCFDIGDVTFRNDLYDQYKAHREPMPPALFGQVERIRDSMAILGIPSLGLSGYEADDLLATLSQAAAAKGYRVLLVTSDKDCRQLLNDQVKMVNIRKGTVFGPQELMEDWGVRPDQVVDFQSMVGDSVDNVPGVPKIGPKAAKELLAAYDNLDSIYQNVDKIAGAARKQTLIDHRAQAYLSRSLVELDRNVPIKLEWDAWHQITADHQGLQKLFQELGFRGLADRYLARSQAQSSAESNQVESTIDRSQYRCIDTKAKLEALQSELTASLSSLPPEQRMLSIDTETTSVYAAQADLVGVALAWPGANPVYIPVKGPADQSQRLLDLNDVRQFLGPFLEDSSIAKVGQNLKYDLIVFANHGFQVSNVTFDTIIADYLCSPGERNHSLDELAKKNLAHAMIPITDLIGTGKNQCLICDVDIDRVTEYAAEDADVALQLVPSMQQNLQSMSLEDVFSNLEMPLLRVLAEIERNGIAIDVPTLAKMQVEFEDRIETLREQIFTVAGQRFNPDSPKQLAQLLFDQLGLRVVKKTKSGPSTDVDVLQELAEEHPLPALIIEYRQITKLKSTYVEALPKLINPKTQRIHSSFRQDVAATGRLSSVDPNLQNIPIRTEEGRRIRSAFKPGYADWLLLAADYSQIELRIMAHKCDDETLKAAFFANEDIHTTVAAEVYNVALEDVTSNQRRNAKAVNFGILYGQSPFGLAKSIGIPKSDAAVFIDEYFAKFSKVRAFMLETLANARRDGFVATMSGRRRYLKGIRDFSKLNSNQQKTLLEPERMAVNTVIQGSAADLIKLAMIRVSQQMKVSKLRANMLLQIHDELVFEVHQDDATEFSELVRHEMVNAMTLNVPLVVDVKTGTNWADC